MEVNRTMQHTTLAAKCTKAERGSAEGAIATVFYDGSCPLCRREIDHYRRRIGSSQVMWVDITTEPEMLAAHGLKRQAAMARFHVLDAAGQWQTGARGFVELWSHLPAYRWLANTINCLRLVSTLEWLYTHFAHWRLKRRCNIDGCADG
jgi:predicted DCC family thiol-disulfide oxidoreductase YuxK